MGAPVRIRSSKIRPPIDTTVITAIAPANTIDGRCHVGACCLKSVSAVISPPAWIVKLSVMESYTIHAEGFHSGLRIFQNEQRSGFIPEEGHRMRMAELSAESGVPVATIKYYLREGLLPPGERTSRNQARYDDVHVRDRKST